MSANIRINTANDNAPLRAYPIAVNTRFAGVKRPGPRECVRNIETVQTPKVANQITDSTNRLTLAKASWVAALVFAVLTIFVPALFEARIISAIAVLAASLWTAKLSTSANMKRLTEAAYLTAVLGAGATAASAIILSGVPLNMADLVSLLSVTALAFAGVSRSRVALLTSCLASLLWVGLTFAGVTSPAFFFFAFPAIWSMQIYLGSRLKSKAAIAIGIAAGYYWLAGHGLAIMAKGTISPLMAISALFLIGIVHYRGGKAAEDEAAFGHELHTYAGWVVGILGAICVTHYWLFQDHVLWQNMHAEPTGILGWKVVIAMGIAAVYLSTLVRWKNYRIKAHGAVLTTALCAAIPASIWWHDSLQSLVSTLPGFSVGPTIGLVIAAGVITAGVGLALNGVRRGKLVMALLGLFAAGAQGLMLINPELMTFENILVFFCAAVIAVCVAGMMVSENLSQMTRETDAYDPPALAA